MTESVLKMRFRLPNGEEFEAEGTREFIESQRNYFLTLIGQQQPDRLQTVTNTHQSSAVSIAEQPSRIIDRKLTSPVLVAHTEQYLWELLLKEEDGLLLLRKKYKTTILEAATLLIAGAQVLLQKETYSALELAKSLRASGIEGGRLDRILNPEIQSGKLLAQGSKRSRTYKLSNEGFAKAFILAEKLTKSKNI